MLNLKFYVQWHFFFIFENLNSANKSYIISWGSFKFWIIYLFCFWDAFRNEIFGCDAIIENYWLWINNVPKSRESVTPGAWEIDRQVKGKASCCHLCCRESTFAVDGTCSWCHFTNRQSGIGYCLFIDLFDFILYISIFFVVFWIFHMVCYWNVAH